jgi:hypothetical protein
MLALPQNYLIYSSTKRRAAGPSDTFREGTEDTCEQSRQSFLFAWCVRDEMASLVLEGDWLTATSTPAVAVKSR